MSLYITPFFLKKKKHMRVRDEYIFCKTNKTTRKDIKNILINIWFNYSFGYGFCSKMLSWSFKFFYFQFGSEL